MQFPVVRPRRLRGSAAMRDLVRETRLSSRDLIWPLFLVQGRGTGCRLPIPSLPGCHHLSPDTAVQSARQARELGIPAVLLFGLPEKKDFQGSGAWDDAGVVQEAIKAIKDAVPEMLVIGDVCLCEYTDHGHCGLIRGQRVDNDATLELLAKTALSQARAGADMVAPSDMMDGRVAAIRRALDEGGYKDVAIMSYAAKYASAYYGPFRDAAGSAPAFGDRSGYQMDPANAREALKEMALDVAEGADILMVKPALPYLDILARARERFDLPLCAYQVSGEFAQIKAAVQAGLLDEKRVVLETLNCIKRAGADMIITYFAPEAAALLGPR